MKKTIIAILVAALAFSVTFVFSACGGPENNTGGSSAATGDSAATSDSANTTVVTTTQPTGAVNVPMSDAVVQAALKYCGGSLQNGDTVTLQKTDMAHDGGVFHFVMVRTAGKIVPLIISVDASTIYEPSDYYARYGIVESPTEEPNDRRFPPDDEGYDDEYYNWDEEYY